MVMQKLKKKNIRMTFSYIYSQYLKAILNLNIVILLLFELIIYIRRGKNEHKMVTLLLNIANILDMCNTKTHLPQFNRKYWWNSNDTQFKCLITIIIIYYMSSAEVFKFRILDEIMLLFIKESATFIWIEITLYCHL